MRVYIAGPMSGLPLWNWPAFERAERDLILQGHEPVNPARVDEEEGAVKVIRLSSDGSIVDVRVPDSFSFRKAIKRDLELVESCEAIYLLTGWQDSLGATIEYDRAHRLGLKVLHSPIIRREQPARSGVELLERTATAQAAFDAKVRAAFTDAMLVEVNDQIYGSDNSAEDIHSSDETRVVSETGGAKGSKPSQLFTAPPAGLDALGRVCGMGAGKYEPWNYRKGYPWSLSANALLRHYLSWVNGQDTDTESGESHLAHAAWHALVLIQFASDHPAHDDRYKP